MSEINLEITNKLISLFKDNKDRIYKNSSNHINSLREESINHLNKHKIPNNKIENYKYSDIYKSFDFNYNYPLEKSTIKVILEDVFRCDVPDLNTENIILLNGFYYGPDLLQKIEGKAIIGSLNEASKQFPELFEKYYSKIQKNNDGYISLNNAFANDGVFLYVPDNVIIEKPIQIINILISDTDLMAQPRNLFILGKNSQFNLIICDHTLSASKFLSNSVTEVYLDENAIFDIHNLQNEHNGSSKISSFFYKQEKYSKLSSKTISLHGGQIRNNIYVDINGQYADSNLYGLYLVDKWQHVDNFTEINHNSPDCTSKQLFKGILDDSSFAAFNGKIYVDRKAQRTYAYQSNNNILLTNDAKVKSKPQLEIYADDVKCSHGSTVGQLDDNALFYLKSRGINEKEAKMLLMYGFAYEIVKEIKVDALMERINNLVEKRLRGELSRCNSCVINCC